MTAEVAEVFPEVEERLLTAEVFREAEENSDEL